MTNIEIVLLHPMAKVPTYAQEGDAGADLVSIEDVMLYPGQRVVVGTGISIAIPDGFVGLVHPRSGLAAKHGLTVVNSPGTIDSGYRGEVKVCLLNTDEKEVIQLPAGSRIAQLLIQQVERASFSVVSELTKTVRGAGGFGSTGVFTAINDKNTKFDGRENTR